MKIIKVASSQGSLDKNLGTELFPEMICEKLSLKAEEVKIVQSDLEETDANIYAKASEVFSKKEKPFFLGGDHSITYSLFKAFSENNPNACLIVFDAHADSTKGIKPVSHEDMNRELIDDELLKKENLLIIGLRKVWENEEEFLNENKIATITSNEIHEGFEEAKKKLKGFLKGKENIYLSIDIDVLNPTVAPGTGYLEENGLTEQEFFGLFEIVLDSQKVKGTDLVEANPKLDREGKTISIAKKIMEKMLNN